MVGSGNHSHSSGRLTLLSICHWGGGNHQEWPPLKKRHQDKVPRIAAHLAQKCREHTGGYKEKINKILNWSHHSSAKTFVPKPLSNIYCLMCVHFPSQECSHILLKIFLHKWRYSMQYSRLRTYWRYLLHSAYVDGVCWTIFIHNN